MTERRLALRLKLAGPILTRATSPGAYGVDAPVARDGAGRPVLPASLVKGKLREAWEELSRLDPQALPPETAATWLGRGNEERDWQPERGRLLLDDLVAQNGAARSQGEDALRHRIRIDDELGAVEPMFLQVVESPFAAGEEIAFEGSAHFVSDDPAEALELRRQVEAGLRWVTGLGALRTAGFGRLLKAEVALVDERPAKDTHPGAALAGGSRLDLELRVDGPLLISDPQPVANLFQSLDHVPGGVLKGAIASTWNELLGRAPGAPIEEGCDPRRPELARHFAALRFTHALPARPGDGGLKRPVTPPLSLVRVDDWPREDLLLDALLLAGPGLFQAAENGPWRAGKFAPDWKDDDAGKVRDRFGWAPLHRELRVRTAIDGTTRRAADEKLFAQEAVRAGAGVVWLGRVDLSRLRGEDRGPVVAQLKDLLSHGLRHLGKTQARGQVRLENGGTFPDAVGRNFKLPDPRLKAVLLQTPALLISDQALRPVGDLRRAYEEIWRELLEAKTGDVELANFFARQGLAGGVYLYRRFQPDKDYQPYPLTQAGSVFLLRLPEDPTSRDRLSKRLEELAAGGLPLPAWAKARYRREDLGKDQDLDGDHWRCCPYLPENGYGEILLDLDRHWEMQPEPGLYQTFVSAEKTP